MALFGATLALGCGSERADALGRRTAAVQLGERGHYYDVAFAPAPSLSALAELQPNASAASLASMFSRELAKQALPYWSSASITTPALTGIGGSVVQAPLPAQGRIRYSCGATLIAPSFAITAGHCVTLDEKLDELKLQMYRPTAKLAETWTKTTTVTGTFPLLQHPQLTADDGYLLDEYPCRVRTRCYDDDDHCMNSGSDVAVLECDGRPGDKYGFLDLALDSTTFTGSEALMHWKHEVLEVGQPTSPDLTQHYLEYPDTPGQNYHYFESGNQLLPLRSIPWSADSNTTFLNANEVDVHGCHGSSGSGILVRVGSTLVYQLAGPAATGGAMLGEYLCQQVPSATNQVTGPGRFALGIDLANPQALLTQYAEELGADCRARALAERDVEGLPFAVGSHRPSTLFSFLSCQLDPFARDGAVTADPLFSAYPERFVDGASNQERVVHGFEVEAGQDYRLGLQAQKLGTCDPCSAPRLRIGTDAAAAMSSLTQGRTLLTRQFAAATNGSIELGVSNAASGLAVGGLVLVREGQVNSFDVPEDRLEAALFALDAAGAAVAGPAPMRFVGDGKAGFLALLERGERLVLLRQALGAGRRWSVRLGADGYQELACGLLDLNGAPVVEVPCAAFAQLDDREGVDPRLGFFVELPANSVRESADVTYVALASDFARDPDQDGVPDVLDNCPGDWNQAQGDCAEEPPPPPTNEGGAGGVGGADGEDLGGASSAAGTTNGGTTNGGTTNGGSAGADAATAGSGLVGVGGSDAAAGVGASAGAGDDGMAGQPAASAGAGGTAVAMAGSEDSSGCGCSVPGRDGPRSGAWPLALGLLALGYRRRR